MTLWSVILHGANWAAGRGQLPFPTCLLVPTFSMRDGESPQFFPPTINLPLDFSECCFNLLKVDRIEHC